MINRGYKINFKDKSILEECEGKIRRFGKNKRKDIFVSSNVNCHDFYYLLADKYQIEYISYWLIINSLDSQMLKNMYRHIWIKWHDYADSICKFINDNDDLEFNSSEEHDNMEDFIELIHSIIGHKFKYEPEVIDNIYNIEKLRTKILDSFTKFAKKKQIYANFILMELQNYFMT
jgi:hypothetical protein